MNIQKIIKSDLCNSGGCPAAILTDGENVFIQGFIPSEAESEHLSGPAGEGFVRMPRAVFDTIAQQVLNS